MERVPATTEQTDLGQVKAMLSKDPQVIKAAQSLGLPVLVYIETVLFKALDSKSVQANQAATPGQAKPKLQVAKTMGHKSQSSFSAARLPKVTLSTAPAANPRRFRADEELDRSLSGQIRAVRAWKA